jgi:hypothetical protein
LLVFPKLITRLAARGVLVPFDVIRSCIIVLDVTAMEGHDLS